MLEIASNDVKAFHGATVGSLDEDALFYVSSRGIARSEALRMITLGFFEPVITRFPGEASATPTAAGKPYPRLPLAAAK